VTAEPYFAVTQPSDLVVAENVIRTDTKGREEPINVKYELLPRGLGASQGEPLRDVVYGIDSKAPLELFEARNAVRIARNAKAERYATSTFAKAEQLTSGPVASPEKAPNVFENGTPVAGGPLGSRLHHNVTKSEIPKE
jgi:hypothetical protein